MRKDLQKGINEAVLQAIEAVNVEIETEGKSFVGRLRTCNARVYETANWYILESYNTLVACIGKSNDCGFDFLRYVYGYTSTSAQHISKFFKDYGKGMWGTKYTATWRSI